MHIIFGLIGIGCSYLLVRYRGAIINFTGPWGWAERFLGPGQSYNAAVFLGIFVFFFSVMVLTGGFGAFFRNTFGQFFLP